MQKVVVKLKVKTHKNVKTLPSFILQINLLKF